MGSRRKIGLACRRKLSACAKVAVAFIVAAAATVVSNATIDSKAAAVPGSTAQLTSNGSFSYGGSSQITNRFVVDGQYTAYCSDPIKVAPGPGTYTVEQAETHKNSHGLSAHYDEFQRVMYFCYGGPGFDPSMWPATYYDGSAWTPDKYYAVSHVIVANTMWYDGGYATRGTTAQFQDWVYWNFFGYHIGTDPALPGTEHNPDTWHIRAIYKANAMGGLGDYPVYQLRTYTTGLQTIVFAPDLGKVSVQKKDSETGRNVPKAGFEFRLLKSDKTTEVARKTTDGNGQVTFDNVLVGDYYVQETKAPSPYLLNNTMIPVHSNAAQTATVSCPDKTPTGRVKVTKVDKADNHKLNGAVFTIKSDKQINRVDGTTIYTKGQVVDTITTGTDGTATSKELHIGADGTASFTVTETKAADGHIINKNPQKFTLTYKDMNTADLGTVAQTWEDDYNGIVNKKKVDDGANQINGTVKLDKTAKNFSSVCEGATFRLWRKSDEITVTPNSGKIAYALRIDGGKTSKKVTLYQKVDTAVATLASTADGAKIVITDESGNTTVLKSKDTEIAAGTYKVSVKDADDKDVTDFTGDKTLKVKNGDKAVYTISKGAISGKLSVSVKNDEIADRQPSVSVNYSQGYYYATSLKPNARYSVKVDGKEIKVISTKEDDGVKAGTVMYARYDSTATHYAYKRQPMLLNSDSKYIDKFTINGKDYKVPTTVGKDGGLEIDRIVPGSYGFGETDVPFTGEDATDKENENTATGSNMSSKDYSYLISTDIYYFTVDGTTGEIGGNRFGNNKSVNKVTQVRFSKKDITGDGELPGAKLEIRDSKNNLVDSWVSTDKPHVVSGLTPGKYSLIERITPNKYDQATRVEFTVDDTDKPQHVEMQDKPIKISAELDKRQEIADPTADGTSENGDGKNKANVTKSDTGSFEYSLDYRSTSNTWTDEFTVYDSLDGVNQGLIRLDSIMTAQGYKDFDGKLNVWYQTNKTPADYADDKDKANATLDDGHSNPWIVGDTRGDDSKKNDPDGDGRVLDYTGWKLWAKDVSATAATTFDVSGLHLADDEFVTGLRFEYGRVEKEFTTRTSAWDRDDLKDEHDDVDSVEYVHEETFQSDTVDSVRANLGSLVSMAFDEKGKLSKADQAVVDDALDRISEAVDSGDSDAVSVAVDDVRNLVSERVSDVVASSKVKDSKSLSSVRDEVKDIFGRVEPGLPADVKAKFSKAFKLTDKAVDSGDPEDIESARVALAGALSSAVDSLMGDVLLPSVHFAPAVVRAHVTDAYVPGSLLVNSAHVDAYRNGGGEGLEGHDDDRVVQSPKSDDLANDLVQTGVDVAPFAVPVAAVCGIVAFAVRRRRMRA